MSDSERIQRFQCVARVAAADDQFTPGEQKFLLAYGRMMLPDVSRFRETVNSNPLELDEAIRILRAYPHPDRLFDHLLGAAGKDQSIESDEKRLLESLARILGVDADTRILAAYDRSRLRKRNLTRLIVFPFVALVAWLIYISAVSEKPNRRPRRSSVARKPEKTEPDPRPVVAESGSPSGKVKYVCGSMRENLFHLYTFCRGYDLLTDYRVAPVREGWIGPPFNISYHEATICRQCRSVSSYRKLYPNLREIPGPVDRPDETEVWVEVFRKDRQSRWVVHVEKSCRIAADEPLGFHVARTLQGGRVAGFRMAEPCNRCIR